ncbi:MAG: ABC transporter ATP-binding protein [Thermoplasmatota archaeon]
MVILSLDRVTTGYREKKVLKDISFEMDKGEFLGVIGPNGCGKSTMVRAVTDVIGIWEGDIKIADRLLGEYSRKKLARKVAVVPQNTYISFPFTVKDIVMMGRSPYLRRFENPKKKDFDRVNRAMKVTGTYRLKDRKISELSGGELQRVITARALSQSPELLLLDEATSHLDIGHKLEMMDIVNKMCKERGLSVLSIFHNLNLAARYCERMILIDEGRIHAMGKPEEVLTRSHLRAVYGIEAEVHENPRDGGLYITPIEDHGGESEKDMKVHIVCGGGSSGRLMKTLVEDGFFVSAGVLNVMDTDFEKANFLDIKMVEAPPFSPLTKEDQEKNDDLIEGSDIVIGTEFPVGHGNIGNLVSLVDAAKDGKNVVLIQADSIEERDYTEGKASSLYDELGSFSNCKVVDSPEEAISLVRDYHHSKHNA